MTAKWTDVITTTVPERVEREETEYELWTRRRSAYQCVTEPATPTEIGRGLQALEPAERAEALEAAGVEPTPPATPEEIGEVLAGLEPDERGRALDVAGVQLATPEELAAVVAALPPDERLRVLRALGAKPAPERTPEALGAELAALDVCEYLRAARAAGIVEARRLPRASSPPLSVGGQAVAWSEVTITSVGGGGGGRELFHAAGGGGGGGAPGAELDRLRDQLRERECAQLSAERGMSHWRERATAAEYAEREATAAADRAQAALAEARAERAVAQRDRDAALLTLRAIRTERDNALVERNQARAERDEARRHLCNERNGAAGLRDALAEVRQARDAAVAQIATELARVRELAAERDQARAELAKARALGPVEPRDVVETAGGRGCALLTERDGSTVQVTAGVGYRGVRGAVVKVTGSVWFENVLVAAQRAGVLP